MSKMEILGSNGKLRPPTCAAEYFSVLYCNRRRIICNQNVREPGKAWKSLSPAEQKVFVDKFEKWQSENNKKMTSILEHAEPFLKKKSTKGREDCDVSLPGSPLNISTNSHSYIQSNRDLEVSKQDLNVEFYMDDYDDESQSMMNLVYDDTPTGNLEETEQLYTASVISEDIDEPTAPDETNKTITKTSLPEPTLPTVMRPKQLFGIIKGSGTRPELATVEWKDLPAKEKRMYSRAIRIIKRDYLKKYEQYLESLSSPELFKHYIKFKKEN